MCNKENMHCGCGMTEKPLPSSETKVGTLAVSQPGPACRQRRLVVKVYGKAIDPFVVFYQDKKFCNSCGFLKLRNCRLEKQDCRSFVVSPKHGDGNPLVLTAESQADRDDWVSALQATPLSPLRSATSILPSLEELREEEEEDMEDEELDCKRASECLKTRSRRKSTEFRKNSLTNLGLGVNRHTLSRLQRLADSSRPLE